MTEMSARLRASIETLTAGRLDRRDRSAFLARAERRWADACEPLAAVYGSAGLELVLDEALPLVARSTAARPDELRLLDHRREVDPEWHVREHQVGYVCYTDRFAGTLRGVLDRLDYLAELGVTYLHLMPLLRSRDGDDDGGYAVADYRQVDPRLGSMADLEALTAALRARGISLCVDVVVNHTAREHAWAQAALAGQEPYRDYYLVFPDRTMPDRYERSLVEVFPDTAPGSFTYVPELGWVWTTFHDYQWDLDYTNPRVFTEMLDVMLELANRGVEVLRLDAVPFLWKRLGTDCQNQPEAHWLLQAFRAFVGMAAPATLFKAEAIVPPDDLVQYLGVQDAGGPPAPVLAGRAEAVARAAGPAYRPECDLAYHNQLMVLTWSSLASRDVRLMTGALARMRKPPPGTSWVTYVRCHDDIGWAITDADASAAGLDAAAHRRFLNVFYAGDFPLSFARGARFQEDEATGDARISGMTATLCGIDAARAAGDEDLLDQAVRRLLLAYGLAFGYGGTPLVYMGDEIALGSDTGWRDDPLRSRDNRWMHRPAMDWEAADRRHGTGTLEGRVFEGLAHLAAVRAGLPPLRGGGDVEAWWTDDAAVFAWRRWHARGGTLLGLANFGDVATSVDAGVVAAAGLGCPHDSLQPAEDVVVDGRVPLGRLQVRWLVSGA